MKLNAYFDFEDRFRGSRQEIKSRLSSYDGIVNYILNNFDSPKSLDIGSGRGEWLEKCSEMGLESLGLENNNQMISFCQEKGLNILAGNAIETIETLESEYFSIISSFHFIEHISHENIEKLLDECKRILKPNGILILETPSIDNLHVSSRSFYLDPTHINPINPDGMIFTLEKAGFLKSKYYYINGEESSDLDQNNITRIISGSARDVCFISTRDDSGDMNIFWDEASWLGTFNLSKSTLEIALNFDSNYNNIINEQYLKISSLEKQLEYLTYRQNKIYNNIIFRVYRKINHIRIKIVNFLKFILKKNLFFIFRFLLKNISSKISFLILQIIYKILQFFKFKTSSSKLINTISRANKANKKSYDCNNKLIDLYHSSSIARRIYEEIKSK